MKLGCGYPMGPLTLLDFVGLDTTYYIANIMFDEFKEQRFRAAAASEAHGAGGLERHAKPDAAFTIMPIPQNRKPMQLTEAARASLGERTTRMAYENLLSK